jgi:hypothetical protein
MQTPMDTAASNVNRACQSMKRECALLRNSPQVPYFLEKVRRKGMQPGDALVVDAIKSCFTCFIDRRDQGFAGRIDILRLTGCRFIVVIPHGQKGNIDNKIPSRRCGLQSRGAGRELRCEGKSCARTRDFCEVGRGMRLKRHWQDGKGQDMTRF